MATDVDLSGSGVGHALALEVEVFHGSVFVNIDVFHAGSSHRRYKDLQIISVISVEHNGVFGASFEAGKFPVAGSFP